MRLIDFEFEEHGRIYCNPACPKCCKFCKSKNATCVLKSDFGNAYHPKETITPIFSDIICKTHGEVQPYEWGFY